MATGATDAAADTARRLQRVRARLAEDRRVCMRLGTNGRIHLDRALPFLALHRRPHGRDDPATADLVTAMAAHVLADGDPDVHEELSRLVTGVMEGLAEILGGALLVEVWSERTSPVPEAEEHAEEPPPPRARIVAGPRVPDATVEALARALRGLHMRPDNGGELGVRPELAAVVVDRDRPASPPGMEPVVDAAAAPSRLWLVGLELSPFYRDARTGHPHPRVVQALRGALSRALEDALFVFAAERTSLDTPHPRALGRRSLGRAAVHVDRRLGEVFGAFDILLQVTPVNAEEAWHRFESSGHAEPPELRYRPLPIDPEHLKRRLFHVPIERVEDPLLNHLFREKQEELDREITLLRELGTPRFLAASVQLHGGVDAHLVRLARQVLRRLRPPADDGGSEEYAPEDAPRPDYVDAEEFARAARREIEAYRREDARFTAGVQVREDVAAGLMVSRGVLRVSRSLSVPRSRVHALVQHEIGTHVVTYFNGTRQRLRIFASGLAGYEPLQEGLAVLAEHLVGGLSGARMRILAGRVLGVHARVEGADFVETFRLLREEGFEPRTAFIVTLRIHRGGGFTKDAAYLRGLRDLLAYLRDGGAVDPLLVGKLGMDHAEAVQELVLRGVVDLPAVRPRYTRDPAALERLEACRGMDVMDLVETVRNESATAGATP